jgi:hypothetical protein
MKNEAGLREPLIGKDGHQTTTLNAQKDLRWHFWKATLSADQELGELIYRLLK